MRCSVQVKQTCTGNRKAIEQGCKKIVVVFPFLQQLHITKKWPKIKKNHFLMAETP